ncbi:MAG TPA: 3-phosphoshikimate 1-carboxyvinyltransferase, partial [Lachnospiraceae bacterium]|nr:3-phosphoshikimate 1-carboxyvinyltransferase [Lachnospiraceae bacterium]
YRVKRYQRKDSIVVDVPGSKSITNRALMLAALSDGECILNNVLFSDDSRAFLDCLLQLGFQVKIEEEMKRVTIQGLAGKIPNHNASINVRSAGTAARFLTVMLAFAGGNYILESSEQMKKRPMEPLLNVLRDANVRIECMEEEGHFPFKLHSDRISIKDIAIDTNISSQFASALLMAGILLPYGLKVNMLGSRKFGAYIKITLRMMEQFGIPVLQNGSECTVPGKCIYRQDHYDIEPDLSGACYFYAMAPLLRTDVTVRKVHLDSIQGDIQFLHVLEQLGCTLEETEIGTLVRGSHVEGYEGISIDMKDFSDQTMTMAVLAPFACSPTLIRNVGHIRFQESDRISAILNELARLGIKCEDVKEEEGIRIYPGEIKPATVETYEDHRMAMAFTLIGLRADGVIIANPGCCAKTFENYFDIINELCE